MRRWSLVIVAALVAGGLGGCASRSGDGGDDCVPRWPHVSERTVRAGDELVVTASASTCPPRFAHGRALTVTGIDRQGHRVPLGTVEAYPSGAFAKTIRVPADLPPGWFDLVVDGFEIPCGDTGSCAAYETSTQVVDGEPDFARDQDANAVAARIAERVQASLERRPSFDSVAIVTDGVRIVLHTSHYDRDEAAARRAFAAAREAVGGEVAAAVRLHIEFAQHSAAELQEVSERILEDGAWQRRHGIEPTGWGPDPATDSVRVLLERYDDADAVQVAKRYGDAVTVSTVDNPPGRAA